MRSNWGGARVGAGRKPWKEKATLIAGGLDTGAPQETCSEKVERPATLSAAAVAICDRLAPLAIAEGTLVGHGADFGNGCELIVQRDLALRAMQAADVGTERWTRLARVFIALEAHAESMMRAYCIAATGRPVVKPERQKPKSQLQLLRDRYGSQKPEGA